MLYLCYNTLAVNYKKLIQQKFTPFSLLTNVISFFWEVVKMLLCIFLLILEQMGMQNFYLL